MNASTTHDSLILAVHGGSRSAINRLFHRHRPEVERLVESRLDARIRQRVDVCDVVQDVLMEGVRRLQDYLRNPGMPFGKWLRHIARDKMIDAYRRHRVSTKRSLDKEVRLDVTDDNGEQYQVQLAGEEAAPFDGLIREELSEKVHAKLRQLEPLHKEIIQLRFFDQISNRDAAESLGISEPAASMRLLRAMKRLKQLLTSD